MKKIIAFLLLLSIQPVMAQDLLDILEKETPEQTEYISATFKGTRIINGHSVETRKKGILEFIISHRFGNISDGISEFFGLDESNIRFALEYALTDRLMLGLGRSSYNKVYDGFFKYRLFRQSKGEKNFPVGITLFESIAAKTINDYEPEDKPDFDDRLSYTSQLLVARKFSENLSLQITPTYIHMNTVMSNDDPHDIFAIGSGGRYKINNRFSINVEYFYTINPLESIEAKNAFAFGVDIETGGHVFQLMVSNTITMIEQPFITETTGSFFEGDIHFGFNISRAFHIGNKKKSKIEQEEW